MNPSARHSNASAGTLFLLAWASLWQQGALAAPKLNFVQAQAGSRTITLTVDEPIQLADLRSIRVEGYDVDQATWIEESDSLVLSPLLVDLTAPGSPKVREIVPSQSSLILEAPLFFEPKSGLILSDTAFGGVLCRVLQVFADGPTMGVTRRWIVIYEPASVEDVFISADIRFRSTMDMSMSLKDSTETSDVLGYWPDSTLASAHARMGWQDARIRLQPELQGHLVLRKGKVRTFDIGLQGVTEAAGRFHLKLDGKGQYAWERPLPPLPGIAIPLGHGVQLKAQHHPMIGMRAEATDSVLSGSAQFRLQQEMKSGFQPNGFGQPFGDAKLSYEVGPLDSNQGNGAIHFRLRSLIEIALGASDAHRISIVSEAILNQASLALPESSLPPEGLALTTGMAPNPSRHGATTGRAQSTQLILPNPSAWESRLQASTAPWGQTQAPSKGLNQNGWWSLQYALPVPSQYSQRQIRLGASLSMDQRLDSIAAPRGWLLYSREVPLMAPPKTLFAQVQKAEGNALYLTCQASPKAEWYSVQGQLPSGLWVTLIERTPLGRIKLPDFGANPPVRLRIVAGNAFGASLPYPADGLLMPVPNRAPLKPYAYLPDSHSVADTAVRLSWRGADPDSGAHLTYDLLLDTQNPPNQVKAFQITDSAFNAAGLKPNTTYFWRVRAGDGLDTAWGPVASFTTRKLQATEAVAVPMHTSGGNPWVYVPRGTFVRDDQHKISVGPFFLQKYEVSQADFERIMGVNPSYHLQDSLPVERVTWEEANAYCQAIGGRLPTEAEWEFAGRAGKSVPTWLNGRAGEYAWYRQNSEGRTRKVGQLKPNSYGLHDMSGNVFEWVSDWYGPYEANALDNPTGPADGTAKVIRGASWYSEVTSLNPSARFSNRPGFRNYKVGFRCAENGSTASSGTEPSMVAGP